MLKFCINFFGIFYNTLTKIFVNIYTKYLKKENFFKTKNQTIFEQQTYKLVQKYIIIIIKIYIVVLVLFLIFFGILPRELNNLWEMIYQLFVGMQKFDINMQFPLSFYNNITINFISMEFYSTIFVCLCMIKMYIKGFLVKNTLLLYTYSHVSKIFFMKILLILLLLISIRAGLPRFRYDTLSKSSWNVYIPLVLTIILLIGMGFLK